MKTKKIGASLKVGIVLSHLVLLTSCGGGGSSGAGDDLAVSDTSDNQAMEDLIDEVMQPQGIVANRLISNISDLDGTETLLDTETGLVWVNDIRFCFAGVTAPEDAMCEVLSDMAVAGFTDWRLPSSAEMSDVTIAVDTDEDIQFNFINPACAVMTASDGWVFTENSTMPGALSMVQPGNAGVRCVSGEANL